MKKILLSILIACQLNGCATQVLWEKDATTTTHDYQDIGEDKVYAFLQIKQNKDMFKIGDLVMMGEQYWYVINKDEVEKKKLLSMLNAGLSSPYQISEDKIEIVINKKKEQQETQGLPFYTRNLCLAYDAKNDQEIEKLKQLSFRIDKKDKPEHYKRCFSVDGSIYRAPENVPENYRLKNNLAVSLQTHTSETHTNVPLKAGQILGSAVTIPFDIAMWGVGITALISVCTITGITTGKECKIE